MDKLGLQIHALIHTRGLELFLHNTIYSQESSNIKPGLFLDFYRPITWQKPSLDHLFTQSLYLAYGTMPLSYSKLFSRCPCHILNSSPPWPLNFELISLGPLFIDLPFYYSSIQKSYKHLFAIKALLTGFLFSP